MVIALVTALGERIGGVFDDAEATWGSKVLGVEITGPLQAASDLRFERAVIAVGNNDERQRIADEISLPWIGLVHPTAWVHESVGVGSGTVVFAGAVVQPETVLGGHVIINTAASVDHDCDIGDFAHIGPGAHLSGGVTIGQGALVGIGAVIRPGTSVGPRARIGAGAAVVADIEPGVTATGVPARTVDQRQE